MLTRKYKRVRRVKVSNSHHNNITNVISSLNKLGIVVGGHPASPFHPVTSSPSDTTAEENTWNDDKYCPLIKNDVLHNRYVVSEQIGSGEFCSVINIFMERKKYRH
jgi:hypothetical protein